MLPRSVCHQVTLTDRTRERIHLIDARDKVARGAETGRWPPNIRMDDGTELTAHAMTDWCRLSRVDTAFIDPTHPGRTLLGIVQRPRPSTRPEPRYFLGNRPTPQPEEISQWEGSPCIMCEKPPSGPQMGVDERQQRTCRQGGREDVPVRMVGAGFAVAYLKPPRRPSRGGPELRAVVGLRADKMTLRKNFVFRTGTERTKLAAACNAINTLGFLATQASDADIRVSRERGRRGPRPPHRRGCPFGRRAHERPAEPGSTHPDGAHAATRP